jgi:DNA polymerase-3 subunit delta'
MMDFFAEIASQPHAVKTLRGAVEGDRMASAYLFEGPSGVGKALAARAFAKTAMGAGLSEPARIELARRIDASAHPDLRFFAPREEGNHNLPVEVVREQILPYAQFAPFEASHAFVIFPDADVSFPEQHPEAANAMLKTLEEPRPGVHFILLTSRPDRLLQTIRSRCQRVRFQRLDDAYLDGLLAARGVPESTRRVAVALADGRADKALALATVQGEVALADSLFELALRVDGVAEEGRPGAVVSMAEELSRSPDLDGVIEALTAYYRDVARAASGLPDEALAFRHHAARVRARGEAIGAPQSADAVLGLRELEELLRANANKDLAIADWLFSIGREPMALRARRRAR